VVVNSAQGRKPSTTLLSLTESLAPESKVEDAKIKKNKVETDSPSLIAYVFGYGIQLFFLLILVAVGSAVFSHLKGEPDPVYTILVRMGCASRVHRSRVTLSSWDMGEYKTCTSANSGDHPVGLNCGGSQEREMDVRYYGMIYSRDAGTPAVFTWDCKKVDERAASIECRR
jgi:hypothetical protein